MVQDRPGGPAADADPAVTAVIRQLPLRPTGVLLIVFGDYLTEPGALVSASSLVQILDGVGVGESAARATLSRMVRRGLLLRAVRGRRAYFGLTGQGRRTTLDGRSRVQHGRIVDDGWDGAWTVVGFSMPQAWQRERHDLRARLQWAGFGMLHSGLWICPRRVDVVAALDGLGLDQHVRAFDAAPAAPTEAARLVADAYDLAGLARRYTDFVARWTPFDGAPPSDPPARCDALSRRIVVSADWLQVTRGDPRLPPAFLPPDWPAVAAESLFRRLDDTLRPAAERSVRDRLDLVSAAPVPTG